MKKISIIGATIIGNRGAEAMLSTTVGRIKEKYPKSTFYVYSYFPEEDKKLLENVDNIVVHSSTPLYLVAVLFPLSLLFGFFKLLHLENIFSSLFPKSIEDLSQSDLLIDVAGVSFMDGREIFLPFNVLTILPAMLVGTPVVKMAQGMGTFKNICTKISAKLFLSKCQMIFARGDITYSYVDLFFKNKKNYQLASDTAFSFKKGDCLSVENTEYVEDLVEKIIVLKNKSSNIIGICPSSVVYQKSLKNNSDYISTLANMIEELLKNDDNMILLFPNATKESSDGKLRNNDLPIIKMIVNELKIKGIDMGKVLFITKDINTDSIKSLIEQCNITIVSRFHAMIASLSLSVPTMVLGWSHKYLEVMKQFDMDRFVYDYKQDDKDLVNQISEVLNNELVYKNQINKALPAVKKESFKQFEYIFDNILK